MNRYIVVAFALACVLQSSCRGADDQQGAITKEYYDQVMNITANPDAVEDRDNIFKTEPRKVREALERGESDSGLAGIWSHAQRFRAATLLAMENQETEGFDGQSLLDFFAKKKRYTGAKGELRTAILGGIVGRDPLKLASSLPRQRIAGKAPRWSFKRRLQALRVLEKASRRIADTQNVPSGKDVGADFRKKQAKGEMHNQISKLRKHYGTMQSLLDKGDPLNMLRAHRLAGDADRKGLRDEYRYNPVLSSIADEMAVSKKTPIVMAIIAALSFLARRGLKIDDKYAAAQQQLKDAEESLYQLIPAARTKPWYKPLTFYVYDDAKRSVEEQAAIVKAYEAYLSALSSYRNWRSGSWFSKAGMYGGAAAALGSAAYRAHEKHKGYLPAAAA